MSQPNDVYVARLGQPQDWGLTADSFAPLRDELTDHLHCLARESGVTVATESAEKLAAPKSRRKLTATRIADQVYATLHRKPTKREWRELAWLLFWFVVILISDWMAHRYLEMLGPTPEDRLHSADAIKLQAYMGWLLQGISRAGFFALFAMTLWHAWRTGSGVFLARILQLKLIHTLLVIAAFYSVGSSVFSHNFVSEGWDSSAPTALTGPVISATLLAIGILLWISLRRHWPLALSFVLLAVFLYSGAPVNYEVLEVTKPILTPRQLREKEVDIVDGKGVVRLVDPHAVLMRFKTTMEAQPNWSRLQDEYDFENNKQTFQSSRFPFIFGSIYSGQRAVSQRINSPFSLNSIKGWSSRVIDKRSTTPVSVGGAGLGWLAAPIPLLGVVGLVALLLLMGRRSVASFAVYSALCFIAIVATILPFFVVQQFGMAVWFSALGMVAGPFHGFDSLFVGESVEDDWMLILGLVLSAGIPWLLTAMFLKPNQRDAAPSGPELAA
ncbi:MAG: hypothetical protein M3R04_09990 [bacterium]|nr:hypothetical protein [bacterium]